MVPTRALDFANCEIYVRFQESARGADGFVMQSHAAPINKSIMEQLIMVDALKRASAKRITVIVPFYGYARQDKKHRGREPISARLMADLLRRPARTGYVWSICTPIRSRVSSTARSITFSRCRSWRTTWAPSTDRDKLTVVSPDAGRVRVADRGRTGWVAPLAIIHKRRDPDVANQVTVHEVVGEVEGRVCVLVDDMIDTGGTIVPAADALYANGAEVSSSRRRTLCCPGPAADRLKNSKLRSSS